MLYTGMIFTLVIGGAGFLSFLVALGYFFCPDLLKRLSQSLRVVVWEESGTFRRPRLSGLLFLIISVIIYWLLYFQKIYRFWQ